MPVPSTNFYFSQGLGPGMSDQLGYEEQDVPCETSLFVASDAPSDITLALTWGFSWPVGTPSHCEGGGSSRRGLRIIYIEWPAPNERGRTTLGEITANMEANFRQGHTAAMLCRRLVRYSLGWLNLTRRWDLEYLARHACTALGIVGPLEIVGASSKAQEWGRSVLRWCLGQKFQGLDAEHVEKCLQAVEAHTSALKSKLRPLSPPMS